MGVLALLSSHRLVHAAALIASVAAPAAAQTTSNTATVNLAAERGTPAHLASGFIYGMPDEGFGQSPNQIPAKFYKDMGFKYGRAGGAQMTEGGWIDGMDAYYARFNSTMQNYRKARQFGARFQILPHDVWGTDHANSSTLWPGDNGDWTNYIAFVKQLMGDLAANHMLNGLDWDLWNEPDGGFFWQRSQEQYLEMWNMTYSLLRSSKKFSKVLIVGPSLASQPSSSNSWWTTWLQYVVQNNVVPDQYTWHDEPGDVATDMANFTPLLTTYNAPTKQVNINEYGTYDQQNSAGAAWWISRLERYNAIGLRGNWLSTCQLHDFMASLLGKADLESCASAKYYGNGEYQVYKYYNQNMTGTRATPTTSGDGVIDVYTTIGGGTVKTLTGVLTNTGTWYLTIGNLTAVGLPNNGTLNIQTWGSDDAGHYGGEGYPSNRGVYGHEYTAWVFEFAVGS